MPDDPKTLPWFDVLSEARIPLLQGMTLLNGLYVIAGEGYKGPRRPRASVTCLDTDYQPYRMDWNGETWTLYGHVEVNAVPDIRNRATRHLVREALRERFHGERPPAEYTVEDVATLAEKTMPMRDLTPEARYRVRQTLLETERQRREGESEIGELKTAGEVRRRI